MAHGLLDYSPPDGSMQEAYLNRLDKVAIGLGVNGQVGLRVVPKFARNPDVDAAEDIWDGGGDYTGFPTTAAETLEVFSSSIEDDFVTGTGAKTIRIFYLDEDYNAFDADENFLYVDVNLDGTVPVSTGVLMERVWKAKVISSGTSQTNVGAITGRWDTTTANIFFVMPAAGSQSSISNFTIPAGWKGYMRHYSCQLNDNTANRAEMAIKVRDVDSNTVRLTNYFIVSDTKSFDSNVFGGIEYDEKTDICFRCLSVSSANANITIQYELLLVRD